MLVHNECPSPNGRKGGTEHQQKTQEIKDDIKARNNSYPDKEMMFDTTESKAIEDIMNSSKYNGAPIYFIPYNSDSGPIIYMN